MYKFKTNDLLDIEKKLVEKRDLISHYISQGEYDTVLSLINTITVSFLLEKQDYDHYKITPYTREVTEKYKLKHYINASIIRTPNRCYLAAQMPKPKYIHIFRDFIKKSGVGLIVSLIECTAVDYFNDTEMVSMVKVPLFTKNEGNVLFFYDETYCMEGRKVRRLRFCTWKDYCSPNIDDFKIFYEYFKKTNDKDVIVHCHAGVGRTGTFIMYDLLSNEDKVTLESFVDIFLYLRSCRPYLVFKAEQLEFLAVNFLHNGRHAHEYPKCVCNNEA